MKQIDEMNYLSDEGKVFVQKETGIIYGWGISLGLNDSIDNYEEIDCPEEHKGDRSYDNTVKERIAKEQNNQTVRGRHLTSTVIN
jgi:hypothetical protein